MVVLKADLFAGLTAAAVVVPKAMAYATIAGLPVQVGLYTAIVPMVVYAFLGSSRPLSVSTTRPIAILTGAELARVAPGGGAAELIAASATLAVLVGAILAAAGALRLGFLGNFISESVLTGFKSGIGVVIVLDQLPKLLGVHIEKAGFLRDIASIAAHIPDGSGLTFGLAVFLLALIFVLERYTPWLPVPLVAIGLAIAASAAFGLREAGVATIGAVPQELPSLVLPNLDLALQMWPAAAGIALMSFTETIAVGRAFAAPGEPRPSPNRELIATGAANAAGGLLGAMPAGGGASQTAVNRRAGAKTQVAGLVTAATALATLAPARAADRAHAAGGARRGGGGVFDRALQAGRVRRDPARAPHRVLLGADRLRRGAPPRHAERHPGGRRGLAPRDSRSRPTARRCTSSAASAAPTCTVRARRSIPTTKAGRDCSSCAPKGACSSPTRPSSRKSCASRTSTKPQVVLLDFRAVLDLEYTALKMLTEAEERLQREGVELWLAGCNPEVLAVVRNSRLGERLGRERMFFNVGGAVQRYEERRRTDEAQGVREGARAAAR